MYRIDGPARRCLSERLPLTGKHGGVYLVRLPKERGVPVKLGLDERRIDPARVVTAVGASSRRVPPGAAIGIGEGNEADRTGAGWQMTAC